MNYSYYNYQICQISKAFPYIGNLRYELLLLLTLWNVKNVKYMSLVYTRSVF